MKLFAGLGYAAATIIGGMVFSRPAPAESSSPTDYTVQMHVEIPMRDGVHLDATIYRPFPSGTPEPVIFMMLPYPDLAEHPSGSYFAARGYVYAYVDTRGRGDSEGIFDPFLHDANDGYDTVEWLARQPWSDGKVATFGGSYGGGDQWQTAASHPPHLASAVPVASAGVGGDFPTFQNIFLAYDAQWLALTSGKVLYFQVFTDQKLWDDIDSRLFVDKAAFNRLPVYAGNPGSLLSTWLKHPTPDAYWAARRVSAKQVAAISTPMLEITGTHDGDQTSALYLHAQRTANGVPANDYLVIGPWDHDGTRKISSDAASFFWLGDDPAEHSGPAASIDIMRLHREWYDHTMKGGKLPAFLENHLTYYVAGEGAECWKSADSLGTVSSRSLFFYLDANGGAASLYKSGSLRSTQQGAQGGRWLSDPNDLSAAHPPPTPDPGSRLHGDGLLFHSAPFAQETELDGRMDLDIWLTADVPDTDLLAQLYLIYPDGHAHALTETVMRARYRNSLEQAEPIHQGQPEKYHFSPGWWFGMRASAGSRLRLIVSSLNDPGFEKNYNSMKTVEEQTGADARVGHIQLLQDAQHSSVLTVPLGDPKAPCRNSATW